MGESIKSKGLEVASLLAWLWTVIMGIVGFVFIYIGDPSTFKYFLYILIFIILSVSMALSAYGIRKQCKPFNYVAVITGLAVSTILLLCLGIYGYPPILLNLAIVGLVIGNWRRFN